MNKAEFLLFDELTCSNTDTEKQLHQNRSYTGTFPVLADPWGAGSASVAQSGRGGCCPGLTQSRAGFQKILSFFLSFKTVSLFNCKQLQDTVWSQLLGSAVWSACVAFYQCAQSPAFIQTLPRVLVKWEPRLFLRSNPRRVACLAKSR